MKYKAEALKYMQKNVDSLKHSNPDRAFSTLKWLGAQPGDCTDSNTFTLPSHLSDNLTEAESAERIADHFSDISKYGFMDQTINIGEVITSRENLKRANQMHLKYVDDRTLAESISIKDNLVQVPCTERPLPDPYHARTGHALISKNSKVFKQIKEVNEYAETNDMKLNL